MAQIIEYNPWFKGGQRRLYLKTVDGEGLGYLDLVTLKPVPKEPGFLPALLDGLSALSGRDADEQPALSAGPAPAPDPEPAPEPELQPETPGLGWEDLALNRPGEKILDLDDPGYRAGVAGEQRTAGVLAPLMASGYRVIHSVPLSPRKDIDHLVIGPAGVLAINTKSVSYDVTVKPDGAVYSDGYRQNWADSIERDARLASEYLSSAARMEITCRPLVAVWSTGEVTGNGGCVIDATRLSGIVDAPARYPGAWVDIVHSVARRSDTWTAHH